LIIFTHMRSIILLLLLIMVVSDSISQTSGSCEGGTYNLVKPLLGTWEEYTITDSSEVFIGTLQSNLELSGCVLSQRFVSPDSSFSYQSFGYVEPTSNKWNETYVFSTGSISKYEWQTDNNDLLTLRTGGTRVIDYIHRLRLTNINELFYDVIEERSKDGGRTWKAMELTRINRTE